MRRERRVERPVGETEECPETDTPKEQREGETGRETTRRAERTERGRE